MIVKQAPLSLAASRPAETRTARGVISEVSPCTPEERLQRIEALAGRIAAYVRFMSGPGPGQTSAEAKEMALAAFYDGLAVAERELGKIHDSLLLV
jgi:hypothetical protein